MKTQACVTAVLLLALAARGQGLDGKLIALKAGAAPAPGTPVVLAWTGPSPDAPVQVIEQATGQAFPATLREGELVFVPGEIPENTERIFTVQMIAGKHTPRVAVAPRTQGELVLEVTVDGEAFTAYHYAVDKPLDLEAARKQQPGLTEEKFRLYDADSDGVISAKDRLPVVERRGKGELSTEVYDEIENQIASFVNRKPFLWPLLAEGSVNVTRNWPMGDSEGPTDHVHQKSFWTAHGNVNGATFWEETDGRSGYEMVKDVAWGSGDAYGWIHSKQVWEDAEHKPVIDEEREYRFYASPASSRLFDLCVTFTAAYGDAIFGDTKEGGIAALRIRPEIQVKNGTGLITTANGQGEAAVWGKASPWCDYSGMIAGIGVRGATIMDHPGNPRHPVRWHVRDYGLMAANYFGLKDFDSAPANTGDWRLKQGESAAFRYRILVHAGTAVDADAAKRYQAFAQPMQAMLGQ